MIVHCPTCKTRYRVDESRLKGGRGRLRCARCTTLFPVAVEGAAPAPRLSPPPEAKGTGIAEAFAAARGVRSGLEVALVAAEPGAFRERVVGGLARCGVRTITADDGPASLDTARRTKPRLLAAALYLPGLTGGEVLEAVRADQTLAATRLVILGRPPEGGRHAASARRLYGADLELDESMNSRDVEAALRALLQDEVEETEPDEEKAREIGRLARVGVSDLLAYHGDEIESALAAGAALGEDIEEEVAATRAACADEHPSHRQLAGRSFDAEWERALAERRGGGTG